MAGHGRVGDWDLSVWQCPVPGSRFPGPRSSHLPGSSYLAGLTGLPELLLRICLSPKHAQFPARTRQLPPGRAPRAPRAPITDLPVAEARPAPVITLEGCVLGATAAYNMQRLDDAERFLETGRKLAPHSSDLRYLEILCACARYVETFDAGDSNEPGEFIRPWLFWHDKHLVALMMQVLTGKVRIAPAEEDGQPALSVLDPETGREE